ncbi:MAG TPA: TPM domain-containing protein [Bacteroidales bacterium]|nr:TPM domain-containing protein [Bacteroidales bacterium]
MIKKSYYLLTLALIFCITAAIDVFGQDIPDKPVPPRLVNDFAGMLDRNDANRLEQKLVAFNDSTSTQISIVIVPTLDGYAPGDYAQRLGEKWGIGQKGTDNGVLVLVKPKTSDSRGEVFIASGYGMEGVLPDITAATIVDKEILPSFREGDYYGGLDKATNTIMSLARGEYTAEEYGRKSQGGAKKGGPGIFGLIFIVFVIIMLTRGGRGRRNGRITSGGLPFWLLMGMLGSGHRSHGGSWGGFSGGGGFGGGGGGGFGGFGGGSFGGGGAGGSW